MEWRTRILHGLLLLVAIGIGARLVADLIGPLLPALAAVLLVVGVLVGVLRRR